MELPMNEPSRRLFRTALSRGAHVLLVLLACVGCSSDEPDGPPPDVIEAVPFESTRQVDASELEALEPDRGDGVLVFTTPPASLADVAPGDVLLAGVSTSTPYGL